MGGNPEVQVKTALKHIIRLAEHNPCVKLVIIAYDSYADIITTVDDYRIQGGTNFRSAFSKIAEVLNNILDLSSVNIAFLTDGKDMESNKQMLVPEFKEMLSR